MAIWNELNTFEIAKRDAHTRVLSLSRSRISGTEFYSNRQIFNCHLNIGQFLFAMVHSKGRCNHTLNFICCFIVFADTVFCSGALFLRNSIVSICFFFGKFVCRNSFGTSWMALRPVEWAKNSVFQRKLKIIKEIDVLFNPHTNTHTHTLATCKLVLFGFECGW